jgi:hypothetical protein
MPATTVAGTVFGSGLFVNLEMTHQVGVQNALIQTVAVRRNLDCLFVF